MHNILTLLWILPVYSTSLSKILWEKEKLLIISNFSFSHSILYQFREFTAIFVNLNLSSAKSFSFEESTICRSGNKVITRALQSWQYKQKPHYQKQLTLGVRWRWLLCKPFISGYTNPRNIKINTNSWSSTDIQHIWYKNMSSLTTCSERDLGAFR